MELGLSLSQKQVLSQRMQLSVNILQMNALDLDQFIRDTRQIRFFERGPGNLVPMTLADVACDLKIHPSTVSRAVRGKYLQCQWGVFGLGDLFSRYINDTVEDQSQDTVLNQIRRIIAEENPAKPFSDQAISEQLQKHGIAIARRTVAKYREQIGIPRRAEAVLTYSN